MWLFVPEMSSLSAPDAVGLNSESPSLSDCWAEALAASATWRGKPLRPQAWSRQWRQGGFIRRLSGLTYLPSTLAHGVERFISSLQATHARTTALPESGPEPVDSAFLPLRSFASPQSAGLILSSAKTSQGTRTDNLQPSSRHWSDWATALRLEYSVRPKPEIPCGASDCSSWPSASDISRRGGSQQAEKRLAGGHAVNLEDVAENWHAPRCNDPEKRGQISDDPRNGIAGQAENWSSPKASDPEKAGPNMRGSKGDVPLPGQAVNWEAPSVAVTDGSRLTRGGDRSSELLLTGQAVEASKQWAAPTAQNHKGSSEGSITRPDGKSREDILSYQAEQFFRLPLSPDQQIAGGSICSTDGPSTNQPLVKRKLNPIFVEALMRWPTGLSGFERQEMAWTRWWLLMPSYLSALCSRPAEKQASLF